jgi:uncharacterized protein YceK
MLRWTASLVLLSVLPGCGTINSYASGCPGVYSGVAQDRDLLREHRSNLAAREPPGRLAVAWDTAAVAIDVPLSATLDTLGLPLAWAVGPRSPRPAGHLGCRSGGDVVDVVPD